MKPWTYRDEIFCRFLLPNDKRRTDLLLATPKADKFNVGPQIASFAYQRDDGGRGFVFGGLDFRDNLALDNYRRFLLNGIAWAARIEIPKARHPVADARRQRRHAARRSSNHEVESGRAARRIRC